MKKLFEYLFVLIVCLLAGIELHRCQCGREVDAGDEFGTFTDTIKVSDTIPYYKPVPQSELALGTRRFILPYYFKGGGSGGEPRCCDSTWIEVNDSMLRIAEYGAGAGGQPRCCGDSAILELPIIQRHYADSTYEAWISGPIDPQLDSLRVFAPTTIVTQRVWKPPKRWHIGPMVGVGLSSTGRIEVVGGVCISYSFYSF